MLTLENSANNFERARIDEFVVKTENIGKLKGLDIGIDGKGMGASWHSTGVCRQPWRRQKDFLPSQQLA